MARKCSKIMEFMMLIGKLKTTVRTGWRLRGVHNPESVSDHMYMMAAIAFFADVNTNLDKNKCIRLALVHDMAECIVGDIAPTEGVSREEKYRRENDAMLKLIELAGDPPGNELYDLWQEYEKQSSDEAVFVKDLDKFEMILQAYNYEVDQSRPGGLQEFYDSTRGVFRNATVKGWARELYEIRDSHNASTTEAATKTTTETTLKTTDATESTDATQATDTTTDSSSIQSSSR